MSNIQKFAIMLVMLILAGLCPPLTSSAVTNPSIILNSPGDGSLVISPVLISAQIQAHQKDVIRVVLLDPDKTTIARKLLWVTASGDGLHDFSTELAFEIPNDTRNALLLIGIYDEDNRPVAVRTARLTLQSGGTEMIESPAEYSDWLIITQPQPGETISDGEVLVKGRVMPILERPIFIELVTAQGRQIGSRQIAVESVGEAFSFSIRVPYVDINERHDVRLVIRQTEGDYGENIILDSVPIYHSP
jgi:hypothetical protein